MPRVATAVARHARVALPADRGAAPGRIPTPRLVGSAIGIVVAWIAVRFAAGFPPGVWPSAGKDFVGPAAPSELVVKPDGGYDGQFVYRLAIEPFTTAVTGHGITFYEPGYRQQRIMTGLLAHLVAGVPGISTATAIIVVNAIAMVIALVAGVRLAESLNLGWRWGLLLALPACLPVSFALDLTEPVEWAGVLCAVLAARQGRWLWAGVAFTFAVLARETAGVFIAGYVVESVVVVTRRRSPGREWRRAWLLLPIAVETAWQLRLWAVWGSIPALTGFHNTVVSQTGPPLKDSLRSKGVSHDFPLLGIARTFLNGFTTGDTRYPVLGMTYVLERTLLLALIATAAWLLIARRVKIGVALSVAWILAAFVALSMAGWVDDIQFLRPTMEVWALSLLVLLQAEGRWPRLLLRCAVAVVCWQVIFGLIRA
jgi:hypothetical protein